MYIQHECIPNRNCCFSFIVHSVQFQGNLWISSTGKNPTRFCKKKLTHLINFLEDSSLAEINICMII